MSDEPVHWPCQCPHGHTCWGGGVINNGQAKRLVHTPSATLLPGSHPFTPQHSARAARCTVVPDPLPRLMDRCAGAPLPSGGTPCLPTKAGGACAHRGMRGQRTAHMSPTKGRRHIPASAALRRGPLGSGVTYPPLSTRAEGTADGRRGRRLLRPRAPRIHTSPKPDLCPVDCSSEPAARDAVEGRGPQRRSEKRFDRRLKEGTKSGWGRLLSVTNAIEAGTWRPEDSGWA